MNVEVRLFGGLAEIVGTRRIVVAVEDPVTAAGLLEGVVSQCPALAPVTDRVRVAVDLELATNDTVIAPGAEVALLPPVAGGAGLPSVVLRGGIPTVTGLLHPPLPVRDALAAVHTPDAGATVSFLGSVRDHAPDLDDVVGLDYSAYEPMAERVLATIAAEIAAEHPEVRGVVLLHALGELAVGDDTIFVACTSAHRRAAFDACADALERVKDRVPVFKRERTADGRDRWVGLDRPNDPGQR